MTKLNKVEAAALLGVGLTTLKKRMREGTIKFTRTAEQSRPGEQTCFFTYGDLGLVEPAPAPEIQIAPQYNDPKPERVQSTPPAPPELTESERKELEDREFAQAYLAREATDSCGNTVDGTNKRFPTKGSQTLLGPVEEVPHTRVEPQNHMNPALLGTSRTSIGTDGEPVAHAGSENHPLNAAFRTDAHRKAHAEALLEWNRGRSGWDALSQSQQRQAIELSNARMRAAFPRGN